MLVSGECQSAALQVRLWAEPVGGCSLTLRRATWNQGIREVGPLKFECALNSSGWANVEGLLESFCESDPAGFQWLTNYGAVSLLISQSGQW
jgi:hypothetical protein